jgi:hypothetical protein
MPEQLIGNTTLLITACCVNSLLTLTLNSAMLRPIVILTLLWLACAALAVGTLTVAIVTLAVWWPHSWSWCESPSSDAVAQYD